MELRERLPEMIMDSDMTRYFLTITYNFGLVYIEYRSEADEVLIDDSAKDEHKVIESMFELLDTRDDLKQYQWSYNLDEYVYIN